VKRLGELTWREAEALKAAQPIVLLPVGSTEAHGPHLPLSTDTILSDELAVRAAAALDADGYVTVIAPALAYAITDYASEFAGTISLGAETATALVGDVCASLQRHSHDVALDRPQLTLDELDVVAAQPDELERPARPVHRGHREIQRAELGGVRVVGVSRVNENRLAVGNAKSALELRLGRFGREQIRLECRPDDL